MNAKILVVSVILILTGICGVTVLAGAALTMNSTIKTLPLTTLAPIMLTNSSSGSTPGTIINPTGTGSIIYAYPGPTIYPFEQYLQVLFEANQGSATITINAKDGVLTISSPSINFSDVTSPVSSSLTMSLTATNFKAVIDKNTGVITITADSIKYFDANKSFQADNFSYSFTQSYIGIYNSNSGSILPPAGK